MKEIKAQSSFNILQNIVPLSGFDYSRDVLTQKESQMLFNLWKDSEKLKGKIAAASITDRFMLMSLANKGYISTDGNLVEFTKRGKDVIRNIVLNMENVLKK